GTPRGALLGCQNSLIIFSFGGAMGYSVGRRIEGEGRGGLGGRGGPLGKSSCIWKRPPSLENGVRGVWPKTNAGERQRAWERTRESPCCLPPRRATQTCYCHR